ncbi:MAG: sulfite exporter TauE/SafE family protein [Pyrinomonadaceae bacterium]
MLVGARLRSKMLLFASTTIFALLAFGFLLGLKHATEADHLAAVSTIVSERKTLWSSAAVGGLWGLGHTISLIAAGVLVLLLDIQISPNAERWLEFAVGVMLTLLGLNVLRKILNGGDLHFHAHEHGTGKHVHPHIHEADDTGHTPLHRPFRSPRALIIGMVHGLAGSAALMLAVIPMIETKTLGMIYIAIFGIGSIGGMMIMSFLVGLPFYFSALKFERFHRLLHIAAGTVSVFLGMLIMYNKAFDTATGS